MEAEGVAGPRVSGDGSLNALRQGREGDSVIQAGHARMQEGAVRLQIFSVSTAVAGVAPGTVLNTVPPFQIWNPPGSGKNIVILTASLGYVSGTIGAGFVAYAMAVNQPLAPTGATELVPSQNLLSLAKGVGRVFQGSTLASTVSILRPGFFLGAVLASSVFPPSICKDDIAGEFVVPPGTVFAMQGVAAGGSSPLVTFGASWQEVPIQTA